MIMSLILILILYCDYYYYYKENVVFIVNKALLFFLAFVKCVIAEIQVYTLTLGLQKISLRWMMDADHRDGRHKGQNLSAVKVLWLVLF